MLQLDLFESLKAEVAALPNGLSLRDYQDLALRKTFEAFERGAIGALCRLPTGAGKTVLATMIADRWLRLGDDRRVMVLCHETQLVTQFAQEIEDILGGTPKKPGIIPGIEMADQHVNEYALPKIVVASRATLYEREVEDQDAQKVKKSRLHKFDPHKYRWLLIIDEAHRYLLSLKSCKHIFAWFAANPESRRLGITATPERGDKRTLSAAFPEIAADYRLYDVDGGACAVRDGWAVPYDQRFVTVEGVDFKAIREVKKDFDPAQLEAELIETKALASMVKPMLDLVGKRRTLVFNVGKEQAKKVAAYINALREEKRRQGLPDDQIHGEAVELDGDHREFIRAGVYAKHQRGEFQFLSVCGLCREGYNDPGIQAVAIFRPTKSRPLAEQMKGRGCRPLRGTVDGWETPEQRRAAIAASAKPDCMIIDLVGVTGMADCASTAHILASGKPDEVIERANRNALKAAKERPEEPQDMGEHVRRAQREIDEEREKAKQERLARERREREAAERRVRLRAEVQYSERQVAQGHGSRHDAPPRTVRMVFGKHKGKKMSDIPAGYLRWLVEGEWCRTAWIKQAAKQELERRERPASGLPAAMGMGVDDINRLLQEAGR